MKKDKPGVMDTIFCNIDDDKVQKYLINIKCEKITNNEKKMCDELPTLEEHKLAIEKYMENQQCSEVFWDDVIYYDI